MTATCKHCPWTGTTKQLLLPLLEKHYDNKGNFSHHRTLGLLCPNCKRLITDPDGNILA